MKKRRLIFLLFFIGLLCKTYGQEYYDTICWVWVSVPSFQAVPGERISDNNELNALFSQNHVVYYEKAYPFAKTQELLKIHEIKCSHGTNIDNVISALINRFGDVFYNFSKIEIIDEYPMAYDPVDWFWQQHANDWLWHLKKIQADLAWDITKGDTTVKTAVLDGSIDFTHPDLASEIYPHYDPYNGVTYNASNSHGTEVASFVAAETTKQGEIPQGDLASVGFNTKMICFYSLCDLNTFLQKALYSSTVMEADIIVSCAGASLGCYPHPLTGEDLVMKEILNNGTVIVMPAGNGYGSVNRSYCGDENQATEHYPFNSSYDERVIVVTSTDSLDNHRYISNGIDKTHSHFPTVDICAPGYHVFGAKPIGLVPNPIFPYYENLNGTSYAAPIVAGACALLKSINKDFTPGEIQYFIKSTADPVVDANDYPGMLGAGRLNVYHAVEMANNCSPGIISSNQIWNNDTIVVCGVEIMQGGCLTINSNVKLSKHSPIIVHTGGRLIVDGGHLTSLDEIFWPGIEVWGNRSIHQSLINGSYGQGYLELKNGAVIENAVCAVELWHPDHWNSTGGIIHADSAIFRNNAKSVHALRFTNYNPVSGLETSYNGSFRKCTFTVDTNFLGTATFQNHIDLEQINGITFSGCSFSVNPDVEDVSSDNSGISAYNATFYVTEAYVGQGNPGTYPFPEEDIVRSSFTGFHTGVKSVHQGNYARSFSVRGSLFTGNDCGIYALNTGYATIHHNLFNVNSRADCTFGVYAEEVTGFCIEENCFSSYNDSNTNYGIGVFNSGGSNDIYRNTFDGLTCGNIAVGTNTTQSGSGLTYSCNQNTDNVIDFCVLKDGASGGIQQQQGSSSTPACNTFDGSVYHFYNDGNLVINYFYNPSYPDEVPNQNLLYQVSRTTTHSHNSCNTHYGTVIKSPGEKSALENDYLTANGIYTSLKRLYDRQIDGGNTSAEVADLLTATPSDQQRLRARLLGLSPYLSQEVLTTASDRSDVFSNPVLFEILAANPDELKKDTLISYLEHKDQPLPDYMVDMLRQIATGTTARTALLAQMARYRHDRNLAAGDIVRSILNDSVANPQELRTWLGNMEEIASDRMAVASYMQEGDFDNAFALANLFPVLYDLSGDELADHTDYMRLLDLFRTLHESGRSTSQLTEAEKGMVDSIANVGQGYSKSMARVIRESSGGEPVTRYACPTLPLTRADRGNTDVQEISINDFSVAIAPNPVHSVANVSYNLPEGESRAIMDITNVLGVNVSSVELKDRNGVVEINTSEFPSGVYNYTVYCGNKVLNGKMVIAH